MAKFLCFCLSFILLFSSATIAFAFAFARVPRDAVTTVEATPLITAALFRQSLSPNESRLDHMARSIKMSKLRHQTLASRVLSAAAASASNGKDLVTPVSTIPGISAFAMVLNIGTPAVTFETVADSGSDLTWIPCDPFTGPRITGPIFHPKSSTTYRPVFCQDHECTNLQELKKCGANNTCQFKEEYGDGTTISGSFATETVTLFGLDGRPQPIKDISFGCLHTRSQDAKMIQGVAGLGRGPVSLVSQLGSYTQNMFSYCLPALDSPPKARGKLIFGASAALQGSGIQVMSIITNPVANSYYWVDFQAIGVAEARIYIPPIPTSKGGTILDSGTTMTFVNPAVYSNVVDAFKTRVKFPQIDYSSVGVPYCVDLSAQPAYRFPSLTLYFGHAAIVLPQENYFVKVDHTKPNTYCLFIFPSPQDLSDFQVIGNVMQQNFQVLYDLGHSQISWQPAKCHSL